MKKFISVALLICLCLTAVLASCNTNPQGESSATDSKAPSVSQESEESGIFISDPDTSREENSKVPETSNPPEESADKPLPPEYVFKGFVYYDGRAIEPFGGDYKNGQLYGKYLNNYRKDLGNDINIYSMIIPTAAAYYMPEHLQGKYGGKQLDKIKYVYDQAKDVTPVDIFDITAEHKNDKEEIYFKTEHHWTQYGAYWAAKKLSQVAGLPFKDISEYERVVKADKDGNPLPFLGSLFAASQEQILKENPDEFFWYEYPGKITAEYYTPDFKKLQRTKDTCHFYVKDEMVSAWYMTFLGGDGYGVKIETDAPNDRVCVVFKDSFGNALVPMLLSSFKTIYAIDIRSFPLNSVQFIKDVKATDVLFSVCSFTPLGSNFKYIEQIRRQGK